VNDGDRLYVQHERSLAGGLGLGAKVRVGQNWIGEAVVRSQRPFSESSDDGRFQSQTKLLFDGMVSASYVTDGGVRMGLSLQQTYQSRKYQLQQLDGSTEKSEHSLKAYGANATVGLDF
jgi:hypothetical protein